MCAQKCTSTQTPRPLPNPTKDLCLWPTTPASGHHRGIRRQPHPHRVFEQGQHPESALARKINELAGTIFVERGNRTSSDKAVKTLTQTLKNGRSVLVFPEAPEVQTDP